MFPTFPTSPFAKKEERKNGGSGDMLMLCSLSGWTGRQLWGEQTITELIFLKLDSMQWICPWMMTIKPTCVYQQQFIPAQCNWSYCPWSCKPFFDRVWVLEIIFLKYNCVLPSLLVHLVFTVHFIKLASVSEQSCDFEPACLQLSSLLSVLTLLFLT